MIVGILVFFTIFIISLFVIKKSINEATDSPYYDKILNYLEEDESYFKIVKGKQLKHIGIFYNKQDVFVNKKTFFFFLILSYGDGKLIISVLNFWEIEGQNEITLESVKVLEYF